MSTGGDSPPVYILLSNTAPGTAVTTFSHPLIQYHYADDSPMALLPHQPDEQVIVLDYDPASPVNPGVKSVSSSLAVTGVKVTDAPGAGENQENDKMYILETTHAADDRQCTPAQTDFQNVHATLVRYKQRNAVLRDALDFTRPSPNEEPPAISSAPVSQPTSPFKSPRS